MAFFIVECDDINAWRVEETDLEVNMLWNITIHYHTCMMLKIEGPKTVEDAVI